MPPRHPNLRCLRIWPVYLRRRKDAVAREESLMGRRDILGLLREVLRNQIVAIDQWLAHLVRAVSVPVANFGSVGRGHLPAQVILEALTIHDAIIIIDVAFHTGVKIVDFSRALRIAR